MDFAEFAKAYNVINPVVGSISTSIAVFVTFIEWILSGQWKPSLMHGKLSMCLKLEKNRKRESEYEPNAIPSVRKLTVLVFGLFSLNYLNS